MLAPQLRDALPTDIIRDVATADLHLALAHAGVDIDVADLDVERAVLGDSEPGVDLPGEVEEDEEGAREVVLEEGGDDEVGAADGPERDVELGCQAEEVHHSADVGAVDAEGGAEGELVDAVAVEFPVTRLGGEYIVEGGGFLPCRSEADVGYGDTAEDEEGGETGQGEEPVEDVTTSRLVQVDEG